MFDVPFFIDQALEDNYTDTQGMVVDDICFRESFLKQLRVVYKAGEMPLVQAWFDGNESGVEVQVQHDKHLSDRFRVAPIMPEMADPSYSIQDQDLTECDWSVWNGVLRLYDNDFFVDGDIFCDSIGISSLTENYVIKAGPLGILTESTAIDNGIVFYSTSPIQSVDPGMQNAALGDICAIGGGNRSVSFVASNTCEGNSVKSTIRFLTHSQYTTYETFLAQYGIDVPMDKGGLTDKGMAVLNCDNLNGLLINVESNDPLIFGVNNVEAGRFTTAGLTLATISHETTDVDKILVTNAGLVKYWTGADALTFIGGIGGYGSGTLNYLMKWTPDGNTAGNSSVYDDTTEVRVNAKNLEVIKSANETCSFLGENTYGGNAVKCMMRLKVDSGHETQLVEYGFDVAMDRGGLTDKGMGLLNANNVNGLLINVQSADPLYFGTTDIIRMTIPTAGGLGIGTIVPSSFVDIEKAGTVTSTVDFLEITNTANRATGSGGMIGTGTGLLWRQWYYDAVTPAVVDAARIAYVTNDDWTSTPTDQNGYLTFVLADDGVMLEALRITPDIAEKEFKLFTGSDLWDSDNERTAMDMAAYEYCHFGPTSLTAGGFHLVGAADGNVGITLEARSTSESTTVGRFKFNAYVHNGAGAAVAFADTSQVYGWYNGGVLRNAFYGDGSFELHDPDCAHGMTAAITGWTLPTTAYSFFGPCDPANPGYGGLQIVGASDATGPGLRLMGIGAQSCSVHSYLDIIAGAASGTGLTDVAAGSYALRVVNNATQLFGIYGDGDIVIGSGSAGHDYSITFNGETNDGVLTWMEDEKSHWFSDSVLIDGETIFDTSYSYASQDSLFLRSTGTGEGIGNYGSSIGFCGPGNSGRRAAIASYQSTSDNDAIGLAFFTHGPTSTDPIILAMAIDYAQRTTFSGVVALPVFNQATEPSTSDIPAGFMAFWTDTDDSKCYLCYNHGGTVKTVELA